MLVVVFQWLQFGFLQYLPCNNYLTVVVAFTTNDSFIEFFCKLPCAALKKVRLVYSFSGIKPLPAIWSFWTGAIIYFWIYIAFTIWALLSGCPLLLVILSYNSLFFIWGEKKKKNSCLINNGLYKTNDIIYINEFTKKTKVVGHEKARSPHKVRKKISQKINVEEHSSLSSTLTLFLYEQNGDVGKATQKPDPWSKTFCFFHWGGDMWSYDHCEDDDPTHLPTQSFVF